MASLDGDAAALDAYLASKGLRVEVRAGRGRCLVAARPFSVGELVVSQQPYAHAVSDGAAACDACAAQPAAPRRCSACWAVAYCGPACQRAGFAAHRQECPTLASLAQRGRRPPATLRLLHRVLLRRASGCDAPHERASLAALETLEAAPAPGWPAPVRVGSAQMAALLCSYCPLAAPAEAASLLLALRVNAHTVCDGELQPLGVGLYPALACANHSCAPTCVLTFRGFEARLRCVRPLSPGREVTLAYVDLMASAAERRAALRSSYLFDCACERCAAATAPGGCLADRALGGEACAACAAALPACAPAAGGDSGDGGEGSEGGGVAAGGSRAARRRCAACGAAAPPPCPLAAAAGAAAAEAARHRCAGAPARAAVAAAAGLARAAASLLPATAAVATRLRQEAWRAAADAGDWAAALRHARGATPGVEAACPGAAPSPLLALHLAAVARLAGAAGDAAGAAEAGARAAALLADTHGADASVAVAAAGAAAEMAAEAAHRRAVDGLGSEA